MCQKMYCVDDREGAKVKHLWEFILRPVGNFQQCQEYDAGGLEVHSCSLNIQPVEHGTVK